MKLLASLTLILIGVFGNTIIKGVDMACSTKKPAITVRWENDPIKHQLISQFLWEWPFFRIFDKSLFQQYQLPQEPIPYRYDSTSSIEGATLSTLLEELVSEVTQGKTTFTNFTILRDRTFNRQLKTGSMTLKFNDYPFVVKVFIETPYSFVNPFKRGWESYIMHLVGGGINRHIAGFTRIANLIRINKKITQDPYWSTHAGTPCKWFWVPAKDHWLEITGHNIGSKELQTITIPSTYCIIANAIEAERAVSCSSWKDIVKLSKQERAYLQEQIVVFLKLNNYLGFCVDPNIDNFIIERGTKKIVIIDTEHYPSLAGLTRKPKSITYLSFLPFLYDNILRNVLFGPKEQSGRPFDIDAQKSVLRLY